MIRHSGRFRSLGRLSLTGFWHRGAILLLTIAIAVVAGAAQDVVTVGSVSSNGPSVTVPIYIRDNGGTPLGVDQPAGSKIQSFSIRVSYSPAAAVSSIAIERAGITAGLTPILELKPESAGTISILDTFQESTNPIPFTLNAGGPGNQVARLVVTLSSSATAGSTITLALDAGLTQLTDEGGTASTKETAGNGRLALVDGSISIPPLSISLSPSSRNVEAGKTTTFTATTSFPVAGATTVTVTSSKPSVATVPESVLIHNGSRTATITVTAVAVGNATITATLPIADGGASDSSTVKVTEPPVVCATPEAPVISGPSTVDAGTPFTISWGAVSDATSYVVDEASDAAFSDAAQTEVTATQATFTIATDDTSRYYRARALNQSAGCDTASPNSATHVVTTPPPPPPVVSLRRIFTVVGSTPGNLGSYFRTSLQLYNPTDDTISGTITFHSAGTSASPSDPSLAYAIGPGKSVSYDDLLPAMGVASGLGSADLDTTPGAPAPVMSMRVFNDAGAAGTSGLAQDPLRPEDALPNGSTGVILAPSDMVKLRFNVGIRTLDLGAAMTIVVRDVDGIVVKTVAKTFPANSFVQLSSSVLLDGLTLTGGESISFTLTAGSAIIYGATTDNSTNDPSQQFARPVGE